MSEEVKFIFKTLLKVPIIIFVSFFIFNIFAFFFIYFKTLGVSYVVMQVAVENNYLPAEELQSLYDYVNSFKDAEMVQDAAIIVGKKADGSYLTMTNRNDINATEAIDARKRRQYGNKVLCGVYVNYELIWPLDYSETLNAGKVSGIAGTGSEQGFKSDAELTQMREDNKSPLDIRIVYEVPGLKYYPDLLTY